MVDSTYSKTGQTALEKHEYLVARKKKTKKSRREGRYIWNQELEKLKITAQERGQGSTVCDETVAHVCEGRVVGPRLW